MTDETKLVITADTTIDPIQSFLKASNESPIFHPVIAPYNNVFQTLTEYANSAEKVNQNLLIWTTPERVIPSLSTLWTENSWDIQSILTEVDQFAELILGAAPKFELVYVMSWALPPYFRWIRTLAMTHNQGLSNIVMQLNLRMSQLLSQSKNIIILDTSYYYSSLQRAPFDSKMYALGKINYTRDFFATVSNDLKAIYRGFHGGCKKLIIVDLDNTLWGGIIGDDGVNGVKLGGVDPIGESFVLFQKTLKQLKNRGILLAICSKNEERVAMEMIEQHPEMVLKKDDFVTARINWQDKAANVASIIEELNLGAQSVVFLDDSAIERERVKEAFPEILVPELPQFPIDYPMFLHSLNCFEISGITSEDQNKTQLYHQESKRSQSKQQIPDLNIWLESLAIEVTELTLTHENLTRASQLFNKTNQFNLRTRRLTEDELWNWSTMAGHNMLIYEVSDRFGNQGITGLISYSAESNQVNIVDFILSCRVFGRSVEELMLKRACDIISEITSLPIIAEYVETAKNKPVKDFVCSKYKNAESFEIDIEKLRLPKFISLKTKDHNE